MEQLLFIKNYDINLTTWFHISTLITLAVYFKFGRLLSIRNLDLIALLAFTPGLLFLEAGQLLYGYVWLFAVGGFWLVRLLADPLLIRRPLLEPNLSPGGLTFMCVALLVFLMTNVVTSNVGPTGVVESTVASETEPVTDATTEAGDRLFQVMARLAGPGMGPADPNSAARAFIDRIRAGLAIFSHLAIVSGILYIGYRHFSNVRTGIAAAGLYLLIPYTSQMTKAAHLSLEHVVPAALVVWAVALYRLPLAAGGLLGLAAGAIVHPIFLLPLWIAFYWQRGVVRFTLSAVVMFGIMVTGLAIALGGFNVLLGEAERMFDWRQGGEGFWNIYERVWRIPILAAFVALCCSFAIWPARKNLGTLLSCSAAVLLGTQFWLAQGGGLYIAWYLPLLLLTILRPNLEDRVASLSVLSEAWFFRRRQPLRPVDMAA